MDKCSKSKFVAPCMQLTFGTPAKIVFQNKTTEDIASVAQFNPCIAAFSRASLLSACQHTS